VAFFNTDERMPFE